MRKSLLFASLVSFALYSCDDDSTEVENPSTARFTVTIENVTEGKDFFQSGVFNTPVGDAGPGPATPGKSYQFSFNAGRGHYLSFATMFVQSNDLFYAPSDEGLALYDGNGDAVTGDVTDQIDLWDAGTEVNQEPGVGADQAPRQAAPNTGADENGTVREIGDVNDGYDYPVDEDIIKVSLAHDGGTMFTVTIENISDQSDFGTPFAPGSWVVHAAGVKPLFTEGEAPANGLEGVAEDGDVSVQGAYVADNSGLVTPLAPGVWAVHDEGVQPLFTTGEADRGEGIEGLAEDGDPAPLNAALDANIGVSENGIFNTPDGASAPGPIFPGDSYSFSFDAEEGDYFNFATMFIQSNDLYYAFSDDGIALFNNGTAISGDVTSQLSLWDAYTEVNEFPGAGNNQAPRQSGPDTGVDENRGINVVNDSFDYPMANQVIRVSISSN